MQDRLTGCGVVLRPLLGLFVVASVAVLPVRARSFDGAPPPAAQTTLPATGLASPSAGGPIADVADKAPMIASLQLVQPEELIVPERLRVLVFAPHPDDETLATGGLIQRVQARGGRVRIVFVTNGDGYVDGVRHEARREATSAQDFIAYGERRRGEALKALARLGLTPEDAVFLGFPDDGIDDLWARHWSEQSPFRSPHTHLIRPFATTSTARHIDYAGVDLENEMERVMRQWSADWVVVPDPRDRHPDHCTSGVFVLDVVHRLHGKGRDGDPIPRVFTYLVHAPDYPASPGWVKGVAYAGVGGSRTSGTVLATARWSNLPLTVAEVAGKQVALNEYETQMHVMSPFLKQFLTRFELFAELDTRQVRAVAGDYAARFGRVH